MTQSEETGHFAAVHTLPAMPTPGPGATLIVAVAVAMLRIQGVDDATVDRWRAEALSAIRSPSDSIPPQERQ